MSTNNLRIVTGTFDEVAASMLTGHSGFSLDDIPPHPAERQGTFAEYYDVQFVVGMLLLLRSMVQGLTKRQVAALLARASRLEDIHGRFIRYRAGYVVFQPNDGPEVMLGRHESFLSVLSARSHTEPKSESPAAMRGFFVLYHRKEHP